MYVDPNLPIQPHSFPTLVSLVLYICVYFYFANRLICIFFLDSTYVLLYMIFVFLFLTDFTQCGTLWVSLHLCKWCNSIPFSKWYSMACMYHIFIIHSDMTEYSRTPTFTFSTHPRLKQSLLWLISNHQHGSEILSQEKDGDSLKALGQQRDPTSPSWRRSVLGVHWKDWRWS